MNMCMCRLCITSHQQTVEKHVDKHPQAADDQVEEVIEELKVHHHSFISSREGPPISNKTY